jgi:hypothetical protein
VERVGERLDPELERAKVGGLVEALHLLRHENLMKFLSFAVANFDYMSAQFQQQMTHDPSTRG